MKNGPYLLGWTVICLSIDLFRQYRMKQKFKNQESQGGTTTHARLPPQQNIKLFLNLGFFL